MKTILMSIVFFIVLSCQSEQPNMMQVVGDDSAVDAEAVAEADVAADQDQEVVAADADVEVVEADAEADAEAEAETADAEIEAETDAYVEVDADADAEADVEAEAEAEADIESESDVGTPTTDADPLPTYQSALYVIDATAPAEKQVNWGVPIYTREPSRFLQFTYYTDFVLDLETARLIKLPCDYTHGRVHGPLQYCISEDTTTVTIFDILTGAATGTIGQAELKGLYPDGKLDNKEIASVKLDRGVWTVILPETGLVSFVALTVVGTGGQIKPYSQFLALNQFRLATPEEVVIIKAAGIGSSTTLMSAVEYVDPETEWARGGMGSLYGSTTVGAGQDLTGVEAVDAPNTIRSGVAQTATENFNADPIKAGAYSNIKNQPGYNPAVTNRIYALIPGNWDEMFAYRSAAPVGYTSYQGLIDVANKDDLSKSTPMWILTLPSGPGQQFFVDTLNKVAIRINVEKGQQAIHIEKF